MSTNFQHVENFSTYARRGNVCLFFFVCSFFFFLRHDGDVDTSISSAVMI